MALRFAPQLLRDMTDYLGVLSMSEDTGVAHYNQIAGEVCAIPFVRTIEAVSITEASAPL